MGRNDDNINEWYMFGTGIVAFNIATAVFSLYKTRPTGYLVTNKGTEEVFFAGELVVTIKDMCECVPRDAAILIATPEVYHSEIKDALVERGYSNLHLLNDQLEFMIMSAYFHKTGICKELQESEGDIAIPDLKLFMAKSVFDKPLQMVYHLPNYIYTVHAGAENSSIIDTDFSDNEGYSISSQNRNYCELSVTYWAWKNTQAQYKGICHYRRIFIMNESQIRTLSLDNVDVVLSLPFLCKKDISDQYNRYISSKDMEHLLRAIHECAPNDYKDACEILRGNLIYNYNMVIAKEQVFSEYCEWLFKILKRAEKYCDPQENRADRYAGYLGEVLTTIYFIKRRDELQIRHVQRKWMV